MSAGDSTLWYRVAHAINGLDVDVFTQTGIMLEIDETVHGPVTMIINEFILSDYLTIAPRTGLDIDWRRLCQIPINVKKRDITPRQKMWQSMRVRLQFNNSDLQHAADVSYDAAGRYLRNLSENGFLRKLSNPKRRASLGQPTWQLINNVGPVAPIVIEGGARCYDPNHNTYSSVEGSDHDWA